MIDIAEPLAAPVGEFEGDASFEPREARSEAPVAMIERPTRWSTMHLHPKQRAYLDSNARLNIVPAGRRGGKSEIAKRRGLRKAFRCQYPDGWVVFGGPTHAQAKRIFWNDLKAMIPPEFIASDGDISESDLSILLFNGCLVQVLGMDVAERAEGKPMDHIVLDEFGNVKASVWSEHVRPMLTDRFGTADFIGVPEGRNHYYELDQIARSDESGEWARHHWTTAEVLPLYLGFRAKREVCVSKEEVAAFEAKDWKTLGRLLAERELESARRSMDLLTFQQEYEASFVSFVGQAYYQFSEANIGEPPYVRGDPLRFSFDFNVNPGTAVVLQDYPLVTNVIGEVYIENDSRTAKVCDKLILDWGDHPGDVICYGDATGGARKSAAAGSDWDIVRDRLKSVFGSRLKFRVPANNPSERSRVNAVNSRLRSMDNVHHVCVHKRCRYLIRDLEGVRVLEGSAGDIEKKKDPMLTHISDAFGYFIAHDHPIRRGRAGSRQI